MLAFYPPPSEQTIHSKSELHQNRQKLGRENSQNKSSLWQHSSCRLAHERQHYNYRTCSISATGILPSPELHHIPGVANTMADNCSRLWHLNDSQLVYNVYNVKCPQKNRGKCSIFGQRCTPCWFLACSKDGRCRSCTFTWQKIPKSMRHLVYILQFHQCKPRCFTNGQSCHAPPSLRIVLERWQNLTQRRPEPSSQGGGPHLPCLPEGSKDPRQEGFSLVSIVIRKRFCTAAIDRIFASNFGLYHTCPKPSKVPTCIDSWGPPFVWTLSILPSGDSPILVSIALFQKTHMLDSPSSRIQLGLIREEWEAWVSETLRALEISFPTSCLCRNCNSPVLLLLYFRMLQSQRQQQHQ